MGPYCPVASTCRPLLKKVALHVKVKSQAVLFFVMPLVTVIPSWRQYECVKFRNSNVIFYFAGFKATDLGTL
jgi:hypothetical protein